MKKVLGMYALLAFIFSPVMFGMDPQHQAMHKKQEGHGHHLADLEKRLEADFEKAADIVHEIVQKGGGILKEEPQVIAAVLQTVGIKQQDAQNITNTIEGIGEKVIAADNKAHNFIQELEKKHAEKK